jgi:type IV fimbrial biogenesis protein FimT
MSAVWRFRLGSTISGNTARHSRGYSLHDVLVTLAVVGSATTAVASLHGVVQSHQRTTGVNDLMATLNLARSTAVTRGAETVLCPSRDNLNCSTAGGEQTLWHGGMMLFVDENDDGHRAGSEPLVHTHTPDTSQIRIKSSPARARVVFQPNGFSRGTTVTFTVCAGSNPARYIVLNNAGRARVSSLPGDGRIDEIHEMCP